MVDMIGRGGASSVGELCFQRLPALDDKWVIKRGGPYLQSKPLHGRRVIVGADVQTFCFGQVASCDPDTNRSRRYPEPGSLRLVVGAAHDDKSSRGDLQASLHDVVELRAVVFWLCLPHLQGHRHADVDGGANSYSVLCH